jgi:hypothetical protein
MSPRFSTPARNRTWEEQQKITHCYRCATSDALSNPDEVPIKGTRSVRPSVRTYETIREQLNEF